MYIKLEGTCYNCNGRSLGSADSDEDLYDEVDGEIEYYVDDKQVYEAIADYRSKEYSKKYGVDRAVVESILKDFMDDISYADTTNEKDLEDWNEVVAEYYQDKQDELEEV